MGTPPADEEAEQKEAEAEEQRQNLFQVLLRDLEIEGVPLLGIAGVTDTNTVQAALWTVASQLSENAVASQACLIFEDLLAGAASETDTVTDTTDATDGIARLKSLVSTYTQHVLTNEATTTARLPELQRMTVNLVGKGLGPALTWATVNRTQTDHVEYTERIQYQQPSGDETVQWEPAIHSFLQRFGKDLLGSRNEEEEEEENETNPNIAYTYVESSDICDLMAGYWNCICELLVTEEEDQTQQQGVQTIVLAYPPPPPSTITRMLSAADASSTSSEQQRQHEHDQLYYHERFIGITKLLNVMNTLVVVTPTKSSNHTNRTETLRSVLPPFELIHLHPLYDRSKMTSASTSASTTEDTDIITDNGHLPAFNRLQDAFATEAELAVLNYQRRSPVPAVIIQRRKMTDKSTTTTTTNMSQLRESWQRLVAKEGGEQTLQREFAEEFQLLYHNTNLKPDDEPQPQ